MPTIYSDGYLKGASKETLAKVAKDRHTDQATRDKAKAMLEQKSGGSSSGGGTSSGSSGGSGTTATAPGHLIAQGSGAAPGGGVAKTTGSSYSSSGSGTKAAGSTGTKTGGAGSSSWLSDLSGSGGSSSGGGSSGGGYAYKDKYSGGIAELDSQLNIYSQQYKDARARALAGDPGAVREMQEANDRANQLRNQYGYAAELATDDIAYARRQAETLSGGSGTGMAPAGGETGVPQAQQPTQQLDYGDLLEQVKQYVSQSQASAPQYEPSQWEKLAESLAQAALGMKYDDWTQSDQYAALADRYGFQGQQSMQDMLGQVSSRTGGLASSYAATAAQQQYNDYMSRLEEVARQMYAGERSDAIQNAQLAGQYSDRDYGRYLDELSQYNRDRSYGFDVLSQALSQSNYQQEWQNKLEQQERQWKQAQYEDSLRWRADFQNRVENYIAMGGTVEELYSEFPDLIAGSGYNNAELAAMERYYKNRRQQQGAVLSPDAGSRNGGEPVKDPAPKKPDGEVGAGAPETFAGDMGPGLFTGPEAESTLEAPEKDPLLQMAGGLKDKYLGASPLTPSKGSDTDFLYDMAQNGQMSADDLNRILSAPNGGAVPSVGYEGITRQLAELEDRAVSAGAKVAQIIQIIETAQKNGTIREDEAKYLLRQYGLMD